MSHAAAAMTRFMEAANAVVAKDWKAARNAAVKGLADLSLAMLADTIRTPIEEQMRQRALAGLKG